MKRTELLGLIQESIKTFLDEAGYDQYQEELTFIEEEVTSLYEKHLGFKSLVDKLVDKGHSEKSAKKIAWSAGVKKYGVKKMKQASKTHKSLKDKEALKKEEHSKEHKCPECGSEMKYDDGRDAYVCEHCGYVGPNGPVNEVNVPKKKVK